MKFNPYELSEEQIALCFLAIDRGRLVKDNKYFLLNKDAFRDLDTANGMTLLKAGIQTDMLRRVKQNYFVLIAKQVQEVVSIFERPEMMQKGRPQIEEDTKEHTSPKKRVSVLGLIGLTVGLSAIIIPSLMPTNNLIWLLVLLVVIMLGCFTALRYRSQLR